MHKKKQQMKKSSLDKRWSVSNTSVYNIGFHIIWCPKYRRKVLKDGIDTLIKECIKEKCIEHDWELCELEVMEDHVHVFVKCKPTDSVAYIVAQFKGVTAHKIREHYPKIWGRLPSLWSRSYYAESVGCINEETVKHYIENQKWKSPNSSNG